jgi:hypothetical protein
MLINFLKTVVHVYDIHYISVSNTKIMNHAQPESNVRKNFESITDGI